MARYLNGWVDRRLVECAVYGQPCLVDRINVSIINRVTVDALKIIFNSGVSSFI